MQVFQSKSIASVSIQIQSSKEFFIENPNFIFYGGDVSRSSSSVGHYMVRDGNVLHLVLRVSEIHVITVETTCGRCYRINQRKHLPGAGKIVELFLDDHNLPLDGVEMVNNCTISTICEDGDSTIHLLIHKPAKVNTRTIGGYLGISAFAQLVKPRVEPACPEATLDCIIMDMIESASVGLEIYKAIRTSEGVSGTYILPDESGRPIGVFKPRDEEPFMPKNPHKFTRSPTTNKRQGLKIGTVAGKGYIREVAAYLVDHPLVGSSGHTGFSGVPPTALVQCQLKEKEQTGSLQYFVESEGSSSDFDPRFFSVKEVHKIALLDLRLANTDRHTGNILVREEKDGTLVLIPIDHGYCFPESVSASGLFFLF
jgi:Phosphatidylinositol 3- and 4-kinase